MTYAAMSAFKNPWYGVDAGVAVMLGAAACGAPRMPRQVTTMGACRPRRGVSAFGPWCAGGEIRPAPTRYVSTPPIPRPGQGRIRCGCGGWSPASRCGGDQGSWAPPSTGATRSRKSCGPPRRGCKGGRSVTNVQGARPAILPSFGAPGLMKGGRAEMISAGPSGRGLDSSDLLLVERTPRRGSPSVSILPAGRTHDEWEKGNCRHTTGSSGG